MVLGHPERSEESINHSKMFRRPSMTNTFIRNINNIVLNTTQLSWTQWRICLKNCVVISIFRYSLNPNIQYLIVIYLMQSIILVDWSTGIESNFIFKLELEKITSFLLKIYLFSISQYIIIWPKIALVTNFCTMYASIISKWWQV